MLARTVQSTREHTTEDQPPAHPEPPSLRVFEAAVTLPILGVVVYGIVRRPEAFTHGLVLWIVLVAAVDLLPVAAWRGVEMLLDFPLLVAVAMLYRPETACAALFIASFDTWEFKRQVSVLRAGFNRAQVAASALAASATFHALGTVNDGWPVVALAGTLAIRSEEHTSELQSHHDLVCRLLLEKKK